MEDDYIIATFLHPNYKQLLGATSSQIANCHASCCRFLFPNSSPATIVEKDEHYEYEPPLKKNKPFMTLLMEKGNNKENSSLNEVNKCIEVPVEDNIVYTNPLSFSKQKQQRVTFPNLSCLACRFFAIPHSSTAVERQFSAAGQIVMPRRFSLNPSTVNDILFLRSIENNIDL